MTPDEETLNDQLVALRRRRDEGYLINRLAEAPVHKPFCDDRDNRFAWYEVLEPRDGGFISAGYFFLPKDVVL